MVVSGGGAGDARARGDEMRRPRFRWAGAVLLGAASGCATAAAGVALWTWIGSRPHEIPPPREIARIELFRLAAEGPREALLLPAGPDATGEPRLSRTLFPDAPRDLVSFVLANTSARDPWDVDLAAEPLRCRAGDGPWEDVTRLDGDLPPLPAADDLRLRGLGARDTHVSVPPGSLRQVLLALPPGRKLAELTDVQWGERSLARDRMELARIRRFREDPPPATGGR